MYNYVDCIDEDNMPVVADEDEGQSFSRIRRDRKLEAAVAGGEDDQD